jgi:hypothetical protein
MIFHPAIFALLIGSLMISAMLAYAAYYGIRILKRWDIGSGSELQLSLERRTYLISTMVTYAFGFQLISLFLFIYTVDQLHSLFVGAMCAAGALYVNEYGYPIYISLLAATVVGLGGGVVRLFGRVKSLAAVVPQIQRRLALASLISWSIFMIHIGWGVISSNLTLFEL